MVQKIKKIMSVIVLGSILVGCGGGVQPVDNRTESQKRRDENGTFFDLGGAFGSKKKVQGETIGVNAYLWRGALDTLSIAPLEKIDAKNGIIQTEWVSISGNEPVRVGVLILSEEFRVSGIRVNVYKRKKENGSWSNVKASKGTEDAIADAILQKARELRVTGKG